MAASKQYSKQIASPQRNKAVAAPEVKKAAPAKPRKVLDVKAVGSIRVLHDGQAIVAVDGDMETVPASKVQIVIEG